MSIRIALDNPPEFYTNLDHISGRVILYLQRPESIGNVIVKLEGESRTALKLPMSDRDEYIVPGGVPGSIVTENHKILYRVFHVYPDDGASIPFHPGQHEFKFNFKVPLNNICHDPKAMSALMGVGGMTGIGGTGMLGMGGFRTMDGTKQLMLQHVKATLPPSLTGFPQEAEIRYYIKVTIQRPGFFKENWRYQVGFKFLPIEPPRPKKTNQEAFARRPFAFRPRTPAPQRKSLFRSKSSTNPFDEANKTPPSIEISARIPFPSILTCNEALPLRLIAKKLAPAQEQVYLTALDISLVGHTHVRVQNLQHTEKTVWVVLSAPNLSIPLGAPADPADSEFEVPNHLWSTRLLPNTIAPSFKACNLSRRYELELKLSISWGLSGGKDSSSAFPQVIALPLKLSNIEVYSGIKPPAQLLQSMANQPPRPPPRPSATQSAPVVQQQRPSDPLYPPQLGPSNVPAVDDAPPPSYDEAMAESVGGPQERPAYSGVTAENAPSTMPADKSGVH